MRANPNPNLSTQMRVSRLSSVTLRRSTWSGVGVGHSSPLHLVGGRGRSLFAAPPAVDVQCVSTRSARKRRSCSTHPVCWYTCTVCVLCTVCGHMHSGLVHAALRHWPHSAALARQQQVLTRAQCMLPGSSGSCHLSTYAQYQQPRQVTRPGRQRRVVTQRTCGPTVRRMVPRYAGAWYACGARAVAPRPGRAALCPMCVQHGCGTARTSTSRSEPLGLLCSDALRFGSCRACC